MPLLRHDPAMPLKPEEPVPRDVRLRRFYHPNAFRESRALRRCAACDQRAYAHA